MEEVKQMIGKVFRTPFEPSGLVRVTEFGGILYGRLVVHVEYVEDHPHGYPKGSEGSYLAEELISATESLEGCPGAAY